jgi:hypothetical protein
MESKAIEKAALSKIEPLPDKARRQGEAVAAILKSVQASSFHRIGAYQSSPLVFPCTSIAFLSGANLVHPCWTCRASWNP